MLANLTTGAFRIRVFASSPDGVETGIAGDLGVIGAVVYMCQGGTVWLEL